MTMATSWQLASFQKHEPNQFGAMFNPHPPNTSLVRSNTTIAAPRRLGNMTSFSQQPDKYSHMKSSEVAAQIVDITERPGPKEKFSTFMNKYGSGRLTPITSQYERFMAQEELSKPTRRPPEAPIPSPDPEAMSNGLNTYSLHREKSMPASVSMAEDRSRSLGSAQTIRSTASDPTFSNNATRGYTLYSDTVSESSAPVTQPNSYLDRSYSSLNSRTQAKHGITYHTPASTTGNIGGSAMPGLYRSQTFHGTNPYSKSYSASPNAASSWKQGEFKPASITSESMSPTSISQSDKLRSSTETFTSVDSGDRETVKDLDTIDESSRNMYWLYGSRGKAPPTPYYKPGSYMYHFDQDNDNSSIYSGTGSQYSSASTYNRLRDAPSLREERKPYGGTQRSNTFDHITLTNVEGSPSSSPRLRPLPGPTSGKMDTTYDINMMNAEIKAGDLVPNYLSSNMANGSSLDNTGSSLPDAKGKKSILKKSSNYAKNRRTQFGLFSDTEIPRFSGAAAFDDRSITNLRLTAGGYSKDTNAGKKVTFKLTPRTVEISPRERRSPSDMLRTFNLSFDSRLYGEL